MPRITTKLLTWLFSVVRAASQDSHSTRINPDLTLSLNMRNVLIALSDHKDALAELSIACNEVYRPGDSFQLVWVTSHAELLKEAEAEGFHEPQGLGQDADKSKAVEQDGAAKEEQKMVVDKYGPIMEVLKIPYQVHIVPTGFPPLHLGAHIVQCAGAESAGLVVLPKASSTFLKTYISERCQVPVVLV